MNYWDASALLKALDESETNHARAVNLLAQRVRHASCAFLGVEIVSAIARRHASRPEVRRKLLERWKDLGSGLLLQAVDPLMERAAAVAGRRRLRAADALYLAGALEIRSALTRRLILVSADGELCRAAEAEGLRTVRL